VHPFPVLQLPAPIPPPLLAGAALFLPAVRHLHTPWRLPQLAAGAVVALAEGGSGDVSYVGVGRVAAKDGLEGALTRLVKHRSEGVERDEGKFADIVCIIDDQ
jgi:translation initiation factor 2D